MFQSSDSNIINVIGTIPCTVDSPCICTSMLVTRCGSVVNVQVVG